MIKIKLRDGIYDDEKPNENNCYIATLPDNVSDYGIYTECNEIGDSGHYMNIDILFYVVDGKLKYIHPGVETGWVILKDDILVKEAIK